MLIHRADVMETIQRAHLFGIKARVESLDWSFIIERVANTIDNDAGTAEEGKGRRRSPPGQERLPFPLREIHTDNGSEFINHALYPYCQRYGISFTRGRPYKKNDQAYVEQKNWSIVRRLVGYDRYRTKAAYEQMEGLLLVDRYANFFQPIGRLVHKERLGA